MTALRRSAGTKTGDVLFAMGGGVYSISRAGWRKLSMVMVSYLNGTLIANPLQHPEDFGARFLGAPYKVVDWDLEEWAEHK